MQDACFVILQIHKELGLSPGNMTSVCAKIRDADVQRQRKRSKTRKHKVSGDSRHFQDMFYMLRQGFINILLVFL